MKRFLLVLLLLLFVSASVPGFGADLYVSPGGSDTNAGTIDAPLKTIPTAAARVAAGDNILLFDGTYPGGIWVSERNGTLTNRITIRALNAGKAIISGSTATREDAFTLYKSSFWRVVGIVFERAANDGLRISSSDDVEIDGVTCRDNAVSGMLAGKSNRGKVTNSAFVGNRGQHGAYVSTPGVDGWVFEYDLFDLNAMSGLQLNSQGASTTASPITNCRVSKCTFTNNGQLGAAAAVNCLGVVGCVFELLDLHSNKAGGISFTTNGRVRGESTGNVINNCSITFNGGEGRSCVQTTFGVQSVTNCRMWVGRPVSLPLNALKGGVLLQSGNTVLPVAGAVVGGSVVPEAGTGG